LAARRTALYLRAFALRQMVGRTRKAKCLAAHLIFCSLFLTNALLQSAGIPEAA